MALTTGIGDPKYWLVVLITEQGVSYLGFRGKTMDFKKYPKDAVRFSRPNDARTVANWCAATLRPTTESVTWRFDVKGFGIA